MKINAAHMFDNAAKASALLKALAHPRRLAILCHLVEGETPVNGLADCLGIRSSTVSQNLALMRANGLVEARRDGQTMWYSIRSEEVRKILETLYAIYCAPPFACRTRPKRTSKSGRSR